MNVCNHAQGETFLPPRHTCVKRSVLKCVRHVCWVTYAGLQSSTSHRLKSYLSPSTPGPLPCAVNGADSECSGRAACWWRCSDLMCTPALTMIFFFFLMRISRFSWYTFHFSRYAFKKHASLTKHRSLFFRCLVLNSSVCSRIKTNVGDNCHSGIFCAVQWMKLGISWALSYMMKK